MGFAGKTVFTHNIARDSGGGIFASLSKVHFTGFATFAQNSASVDYRYNDIMMMSEDTKMLKLNGSMNVYIWAIALLLIICSFVQRWMASGQKVLGLNPSWIPDLPFCLFSKTKTKH